MADQPCQNCGRAAKDTPMCFRSDPWCCDLCRKALESKTSEEEESLEDLPGMWDKSDLMGGQTDVVQHDSSTHDDYAGCTPACPAYYPPSRCPSVSCGDRCQLNRTAIHPIDSEGRRMHRNGDHVWYSPFDQVQA